MPYADPREAKRRRLERYAADPERYKRKAAEYYARDPDPARERAKVQRKVARREQQRRATEVERLLRESVPEPVPYTPGGDLSWQDRGGCAGMDTELFFERHVGAEVRAACLSCPVRAECLGMALAFPVMHVLGFWGGTTHQERARLMRTPRAPSVPQAHHEGAGPSSQVSEGETPVIAGQQA